MLDTRELSLDFTLVAPLLKAEEERVHGERIRFVSGMASLEVPDQQGETVVQKGIDSAPMLDSGFINWDHNDVRKGDPGALIGWPLAAEVRQFNGIDGLYFEGRLFDPGHPKADDTWAFLQAVKKSGGARKAGWSIQGRTLASHAGKLLRTVLTDMALTHKPVLKQSTVDFRLICKSLDATGHLSAALIAKAATTATLTPAAREDLQHGNPPNKKESLGKANAQAIFEAIYGPTMGRCDHHDSEGRFLHGPLGLYDHLTTCREMDPGEAADTARLLKSLFL